MRKFVTVIYTFVLLWYTLLCRLPMFTSVPVAADSTITTTSATEPSLAERLIEAVSAIFGHQPDGTLAGEGVVKAMTFNAMLFVPMGYLLRTKRWWSSLLICSAVSLTIEILQQLTGFGMFDWNDWIANSIGGCVGVVILIAYQKITKAALNRALARSGLVFKYQRHMNE